MGPGEVRGGRGALDTQEGKNNLFACLNFCLFPQCGIHGLQTEHLHNKPSGHLKVTVFSSLVVLINHSVLVELPPMGNLLFRSFTSQGSALAPSNPIFYARSISFTA